MARVFTAAQRGYVQALRLATAVRFEITDPDGSWRDVSTGLKNVDWLNAVTINDAIDQDTPTLSGSLLRDSGTLSLAPFRSDSLINRTAGGAYGPMLDLWRQWRLSTSVVPVGGTPDWKELMQGRMDVIDVKGDTPEIAISGRGEEAVFADFWISVERTYGSVGGVAAETVLQQMLDDNLGTGRANVGSSGYTVVTPVSPSYLMNTWTQPVGSLGPALQAVAEKPGLVLRFRYNSSNVRELTFFKPNRTATVEDWALGPSEYTRLGKCEVAITGVRNVAKVAYADSTAGKTIVYSPKNTGTLTAVAGAGTFSTSQAGVIVNGSVVFAHGVSGCFIVSAFNGTTGCTLTTVGGGVPTFSASNWGTNASLTNYKTRRDIEIDLSAQTQVTTGAGAQGFADAVVSDTQFPNLEQQFETLGFWFVQLYDYGRFYANATHYDSDQLAGITSIAHELAQGTMKSTLGARGKPAGRYTYWRQLAVTPVGQSVIPLLCRAKVQTTTATQVVFRVAVSDPFPLGDVTLTYVGTGVGTIAPASPRTLTRANLTSDIDTTGTVDITVDRAAFGTGTGRITFTASAANRTSGSDAGEVPSLDRDTVELLCRGKVQSTSATQVVVRVGVADPVSGGSGNVTVTYTGTGVGTISPASPQTLLSANITSDIDTTATVDITVNRAAFGTGTGRITFTATRTGRAASTDSADVPALDRDTVGLQCRVLRVSETSTQVVARVEVISPNAGATVTVAYDNGGLTVSPASGGTLTSTTAFGTTAHIDYTITRDAIGGTPRRIAFTASASGFIDATDGIDVPAVSDRSPCEVYHSTTQTLSHNTLAYLNFDSETNDPNGLHDTVTNNQRITIPTGGNTGLWMFIANVTFVSNATGDRYVAIVKNNGTKTRYSQVKAAGGAETAIQVVMIEESPAVGDEFRVQCLQTSGGNLNVSAGASITLFSAIQLR